MTPLPTLPDWPTLAWSPNSGTGPRVLGLNPWIEDFAAYNLWLRPLGLLACLDMLRRAGCDIALVDCLDRTWRNVRWPAPGPCGAGRFPRQPLDTPAPLANIPRQFSRYGLPEEAVAGALTRLGPEPDVVLVTCLMTYWYAGAVAAMRLVRRIWPTVPIVLGGAYATLCTAHARALDLADAVLPGPLEAPENWNAFWRLLGVPAPDLPPQAGFSLALDRYPRPAYAPVLGSRGCPFRCAYCASRLLYAGFRQRRPEHIRDEFVAAYTAGVRDFAFFDDALLVAPEAWLLEFLDHCATSAPDARLHTPNALHARFLTPDLAKRLRRAALTTVRLGLESAEFAARLDEKIREEEWRAAVEALLSAGYAGRDIGVYLLFGLPHQDMESVRRGVATVRALGLTPILAHYSPIPGTPLFAQALASSPYPLAEEPLFQNNSLWPCVPGGFSWEARARVKAWF